MIDLATQIQCVRREIGKRKGVYSRWVSEGKMTQKKADHEMGAMEAVLETLTKLQMTERLI